MGLNLIYKLLCDALLISETRRYLCVLKRPFLLECEYVRVYNIKGFLYFQLIFLANIVGQMLLMNRFLGTDYSIYGLNWLATVFTGADFSPSTVSHFLYDKMLTYFK